MKKIYKKQFSYDENKFLLRSFINRVYLSVKRRFLNEPTIFLNKNPKYKAWNIGDFTYGSLQGSPLIVYTGGKGKLTIGKFCSIAPNVIIFLESNHRPDFVSTYPFCAIFNHPYLKDSFQEKNSVFIGHDVWIGEGSAIMPGVTINNGVVIGARSVVTKDVPAYAIVAGNPAKVIKKRFDEEIILKLEALEWWDWEISKILDKLHLIMNNNLEEFFNEVQDYKTH